MKFIGISEKKPSLQQRSTLSSQASSSQTVQPADANMEFITNISIKDAVDGALEEPAQLSGYIALSDTLLDRICYLADKGYDLESKMAIKEVKLVTVLAGRE